MKKPAKKPISPVTRTTADVTDPRIWSRFDDEFDLYSRGGFSGIGFVFNANDPFAGLDLDDCRNPASGELAGFAIELLGQLDTYSEISPSGTGVKAFGIGRLNERGPFRHGNVEVYDRNRYFTVTGLRLNTYPSDVRPCEEALRRIQESFRPARKPVATAALRKGNGFASSDDELLRRAFAAANGRKLRSLWDGDLSGYPSPSEAVLALLRLLAFWCGPYPDRLETLFLRSPLFTVTEAIRAKWDSPRPGGTWGTYQVRKAIDTTPEFYDGVWRARSRDVPMHLRPNPSPRTTNRLSLVCTEETDVPPGADKITGRTSQSRARKWKLLEMLWRMCGRRVFGRCFLSILDAAPTLDVDPSTASRLLRDLRQTGLIGRIRWGSGRSGKASEYVYLGGLQRGLGTGRSVA